MTDYSLGFQMMFESQFQKLDPRDWFCGPSIFTCELLSDRSESSNIPQMLDDRPTVTCQGKSFMIDDFVLTF